MSKREDSSSTTVAVHMKSAPVRLNYSNPPQKHAGDGPVTVTFAIEKGFLLAHFVVVSDGIYAKAQLARNEYPYDFDVVELFLTNSNSEKPIYYEFEVSPYGQALQVKVIDPRQEYYFGVKNGFDYAAAITKTGWTAEMKIPLASIGCDGSSFLQLIGNAYAALGKTESRIYWSLFELPSGRPDFHIPGAFRPLFR